MLMPKHGAELPLDIASCAALSRRYTVGARSEDVYHRASIGEFGATSGASQTSPRSEPVKNQWQAQAAKAKFSAVIAQAERDGPQSITRHGELVAVVISA